MLIFSRSNDLRWGENGRFNDKMASLADCWTNHRQLKMSATCYSLLIEKKVEKKNDIPAVKIHSYNSLRGWVMRDEDVLRLVDC